MFSNSRRENQMSKCYSTYNCAPKWKQIIENTVFVDFFMQVQKSPKLVKNLNKTESIGVYGMAICSDFFPLFLARVFLMEEKVASSVWIGY